MHRKVFVQMDVQIFCASVYSPVACCPKLTQVNKRRKTTRE